MKTAAEIMKREVLTLPCEATLREAAAFLNDHNISGAPVLDDKGVMVGILSESDLLSEARKRAALPRVSAFGFTPISEEALLRIYHDGASLFVREVMTTKVHSAVEATSTRELSELMIRQNINRVPIVDADGKLVGIVTREDVLRATFGL